MLAITWKVRPGLGTLKREIGPWGGRLVCLCVHWGRSLLASQYQNSGKFHRGKMICPPPGSLWPKGGGVCLC